MPDDVKLFIEGQRITQFSGFTFNRAMDAVGSGISFDAPFFPEIKKYRDLFRPRKFQKVEAFIDDILVFTGEIGQVMPRSNDKRTSVNIQCRSRAGVIVDCTFEKNDFPLQFSRAKLDEIASNVLSKYEITASFPNGSGALFEEAAPQSPTDTVFNFLQNLARQRKFLINDDVFGNIVFYRAAAGSAPIATLAEGQQGVLISEGRYDNTKSFSSVDAFGQERGKNDNYARIIDPTLEGIIRPKSIRANDTNAANIIDAATWNATSLLAASIGVPLSIEGWSRPDGKIWAPNEIIVLTAPSLMVYKPFSFMIKAVSLQDMPAAKMTALTLTIPEAYMGELPTRYPWDE